jgi:beta-1,4-mannosyltransferase
VTYTRLFVNLSSDGANRYGALWLESMARGIEVRPLKLGRTLRPARGDVVHLHWPDHYYPSRWLPIAVFRLLRILGWLVLLRLHGAKIVVTVHNVAAHDKPEDRLDRAFWKLLPRLVHGAVVHARCGRVILHTSRPGFRRTPVLTVAHPIYPRTCANSVGDTKRTLLSSIGSMRPYKRVDQLIKAYEGAWSEGADLPPLYIAGQLHAGMQTVAEHLDRLRREGAEVTYEWRVVDDAELEEAIDRSIAVTITHLPSIASGSMLQVLSLGATLLAPEGPFTAELSDDFPGRVLTYTEPLTPPALLRAIEIAREGQDVEMLIPQGYSGEEVAARQLAFYEEL